MSALPPKADIANRYRHVRFVPKADNPARLFDRLVGVADNLLRCCFRLQFKLRVVFA